jgi:lysophospholipase L1-like esterase
MKKKNMIKRSLSFSFYFLLARLALAQDSVQFSIVNDFGVVDYEKNVILNAQQLDSFFEKLLQTKKERKGTVSILHIGDSHIQADYLTQQVRQNLQRTFGNAGRGLVVPLQVGQTNEPVNYTSRSANKWESKRMVFPEQPLPIGIGGVTIRSLDDNAALEIKLKNIGELDYAFNKVTAFFLQEPRTFHIAIQDSIQQDLAFMGNFSSSSIPHSITVALPYLTKSVSFQSMKSLPQQDRITYFGYSFENGNSGVLYHAMGVNGAKYKHYLSTDYFFEQTQVLHPDLIVISLGTNEALDHPYFDKSFLNYVDGLVNQLKSKNPNALILISTPSDSFKKKSKKNPGIEKIQEILLEYGVKNNLPCFDLYEAGGDRNSASTWRKAALLREDGVHFTKAGYELQGDMFYLALMKAYNEYVSHRRK